MTFQATEVDRANDVPPGQGKTWRISRSNPIRVINHDFDDRETAWLVARELNQAHFDGGQSMKRHIQDTWEGFLEALK